MERHRKKYVGWMRKGILAECVLVLVLALFWPEKTDEPADGKNVRTNTLSVENDYIKWVDFTISYEALCGAYDWDVKTHGSEHEICWVELLAYTAAKTGGNFDNGALKTMEKAAKKLSEGECTIEELTKDLKYYAYYKEAYDAAIGGLVGEYKEELVDEAGNVRYEERYGLKGYFPLARGFDYTHYDDGSDKIGLNQKSSYSKGALVWFCFILTSDWIFLSAGAVRKLEKLYARQYIIS